MKTNFKRVLAAKLAVVIGLSFAINSCKKPTDGVKLIVDSELMSASVSLQFVNSATGEQVGATSNNQKVKITVEGKDRDLIIDDLGTTNFKTANGFASMGLKSDITPTRGNPIEFHVVAHANGYLSTSVPITIYEKGDQHIVVQMVEIGNTPKGVVSKINFSGNADNTGTITADINLKTPEPNTDFEPTKASVNIPKGTVVMDANHQPISGTIKSTLVYFNNQDETSLSAFPGGFAARTESLGNIVFKTGGFVAMEMKNDQGQEVKNFSTPINMTVEIPAATTNEQGVQISEGMVMPIWSYDPINGAWKEESQPTISYNSSTGKYEVSFDMIHLSYWNLDWHYPGSCATGATITISSNVSSDKHVAMKLKYPNGNIYSCGYQNVKNGSTFYFMNAFPNQPMVLETYNSGYESCSSLTLVSSTTIANLCSGNYTVNYVEPAISANPEIRVKVRAKCTSKPNQVIKPTMKIWAQESGGYCWIYLGRMSNGNLTTSKLTLGKTYKFYAKLQNHWLEAPQNFTITETLYEYDQTIPSNLCAYF